jgi:hypothetical protein
MLLVADHHGRDRPKLPRAPLHPKNISISKTIRNPF